MAMKINPVTGQMEDDGIPASDMDSAVAIPAPGAVDVPVLPSDTMMTGSGGGTVAPAKPATAVGVPPSIAKPTGTPAVSVTVGAARPAWETKSGGSTTQTVASEGTKQALGALDKTQAAEQAAITAQGAVDVREAQARRVAAEAEQKEAEAEAARKAEAEAKRNEDRQKWLEGERAMVAAEVAARKRSTNPEADLWQGRPAARVFSSILSVLGEVAAGVAQRGGYSGENRVQKVLDDSITKHRDMLVKQWEATADAKKLFKENREAWELQKDRVETAAANQSKAQLELIQSKLESDLAKLGPDKAKSATEILKTEKAKADARLDVELNQKYDKLSRKDWERTDRDPTAGGGPTSKADDTQVFDAMTGAVRGTSVTPAQAKEANHNDAILAKAIGHIRRINEINAQLPKTRSLETMGGVLSDKYTALEKEKGEILAMLAPMGSQMSGSGAPSTTEWEAFAKNADRSTFQGQKSFDQQIKQAEARLQSWREKNWNAAGVNRETPKTDSGKSGYGPSGLAPAPAPKGSPKFASRTDDQIKEAYKKALKAASSGDTRAMAARDEFTQELKDRGLWGK